MICCVAFLCPSSLVVTKANPPKVWLCVSGMGLKHEHSFYLIDVASRENFMGSHIHTFGFGHME